jgi:hypothetical protein
LFGSCSRTERACLARGFSIVEKPDLTEWKRLKKGSRE